MRRSYTAVVARNEPLAGEWATEPYEAGWATEALFFVRLLVDVGDERLRPLAEAEPTPVVDHDAAVPRELERGLPPERRRAACAVDAEDGLPRAVLLVVERDAVDLDLCHATSVRRRRARGIGRTPHSPSPASQGRRPCSIAKRAAAAREETSIFA